jgi:anti-anti-sigma regulatory factor
MIFDAVRALDRNGKKLVVLNPQPLVERTLDLGGVNASAVIIHDPYHLARMLSQEVAT